MSDEQIIEWQENKIERLEQGIRDHISKLIYCGLKEDSVTIIRLKELLK